MHSADVCAEKVATEAVHAKEYLKRELSGNGQRRYKQRESELETISTLMNVRSSPEAIPYD